MKPVVPHLIPKAINPLHQMKVMGRLVRRSVKKPGTPPGTLVHTGEKKVERVRISFIDYDASGIVEKEVPTVEECLDFKDSASVSWVNMDGLHEVEHIRKLGDHFGWHPLMLEDIVSVGQRAKLEEYDDHVFLVLPMLGWREDTQQVEVEQLSLVLGERYVFTFQERVGDVFEGVRERIRNGRGRIRSRGADYLTYALADAVVDHYFQVLERIGDVVELLESEVLAEPRHETMLRLHSLKRELLSVRRAVWPIRETLSSLVRSDDVVFTEETLVFMRDVHDHAAQVAETVEVLRDVVSSAMDLYLSNVGFRTNEVMKVLTIMASIFIPLTFFAGLYGMNFEYMPELHMRFAYPTLLVAMAGIAAGMVVYFRKKGWM